ncbi:FAD/NAD(P)-binding domain-containing protein [Aspergillus sclerotioniger CBS 115572]|uniref:FAD/NAD(P)-binding domain-containing protein n=1 Tax=Aspergillus sclerotioniger CBS 115572 TaxID=1450535 RepID=A0A317WNP2_9EURO|nr:FAD/NAD(P)-binding domain-containing protein [Aspergillus sclerotioniger CBS 115572]PWY88089.1 FAD/NAD(P)-binding domain-containing protein [Aspergillus sclerotioniger CBS 115572]
MSPKNIVILGGSYGGLSTTHYLLKLVLPALPPQDAYQIIVISASSQAMCRQACPRAMISDDMFPQDKLFVNIPDQFAQYPKDQFRFVHGTATRVDHINRTVLIASSAAKEMTLIDFHSLVIATGASSPSPLLGLNQDEAFLHKQWDLFRSALPAAKRIVIAGGGPAGIETAGELGEYLNGRAGWFSSKAAKPKVSITVVTSGSQILPALRPALATKAEKYLADVGVTVLKNTRVKAISPPDVGTQNVASKATITLDNGKLLEADIYIPATGTTPNTSFIDPSLLSTDHRINTNNTFRVEKAGPHIYAIGDVAGNVQYPTVHIILNSIPVLCANMKMDLRLAAGVEPSKVGQDRVFEEDTRINQMVPIGRSKGVGEAMGFQLPSWLVWLVKGRDYWLWTTGMLWSGRQWGREK